MAISNLRYSTVAITVCKSLIIIKWYHLHNVWTSVEWKCPRPFFFLSNKPFNSCLIGVWISNSDLHLLWLCHYFYIFIALRNLNAEWEQHVNSYVSMLQNSWEQIRNECDRMSATWCYRWCFRWTLNTTVYTASLFWGVVGLFDGAIKCLPGCPNSFKTKTGQHLS